MIPGLFLLSITLLAFDKYLVVAVITLSLGFNGAATVTNLQNSQDLAPNFAGTLYGIINFVGTSSGFISPIIVAYFTENGVRQLNNFVTCCFNEFIKLFSTRFMNGNMSFGWVELST